jgi:hypothetical protein
MSRVKHADMWGASGMMQQLFVEHCNRNRAVAPGISGVISVVTLDPDVTLGNGDRLRPTTEIQLAWERGERKGHGVAGLTGHQTAHKLFLSAWQ